MIRPVRRPTSSGPGGRPTVALTTLLAGGMLIGLPAGAQNVDTSDWNCEYCPFEQGYRADVEIGATGVDSPSAYFGDATGYDEDGVYANLDGTGLYSGEGYRLAWTLEDLGLDSRFAELEGARPGSFDYSVSWRQIPRRQYFTTYSIFEPGGGSELLLPDPWTRAGTTDGFTDLFSSIEVEPIESDRSILTVGGSYLATSRLTLSADYRRQQHDGVDILGGSYFTNATQLPMPFDYVTDEVDLGIRYAGNNYVLSAAWYLSDFESDESAFRWESPFTTAPGAEFGALAQPPDNSFQQVTLAGSYAIPDYRTYLSASASFGSIEQDDAFLPYTTNANLDPGSPPRANLAGEVDTASYAFSVTSDAIRRARLSLSYRYDERDNGTPQDVYTRVITDSFVSNDPETNIPYSYERSTLLASAEYRLLDTLRISAGYDRRTVDRDFQEVAEQDEDTGWGRLRWTPFGLLDIDLKGGAAKREIDRYNETVAVAFGQNPLMRKYNLAYRYREFGELTIGAALPDTPLSITLTGLYADDSYSQSPLGLISGENRRFAADLSWTINETSSLYLNGGYENIESVQLGAELLGEADWQASNDDDFYTYGAGLRIRQIAERFDLQLDYTRSEGTSSIVVDPTGSAASEFPDLETTLDYLRLKLGWQWSERLEISAWTRFQRFEAEDWALERVGPSTIPLVLSLGADPYGDEVVSVGLGFRYAVGKGSAAGGG